METRQLFEAVQTSGDHLQKSDNEYEVEATVMLSLENQSNKLEAFTPAIVPLR